MPTWTTKQIEELSEAYRNGDDLRALAERFNRSPSAIAVLLHRSGVKRRRKSRGRRDSDS